MTKKLCTNCLHFEGRYCRRASRYTGLPVSGHVSCERVLALPWHDVCGLRGRFWSPKNLSDIVEGLGELNLSFGALSEQIITQLARQNVYPPIDICENWQKTADAITRLHLHEYITKEVAEKARKKLHKLISDNSTPMEIWP